MNSQFQSIDSLTEMPVDVLNSGPQYWASPFTQHGFPGFSRYQDMLAGMVTLLFMVVGTVQICT